MPSNAAVADLSGRIDRLSVRLGLAGLALFAFSAWLATAAASVGLLLVFLAFLLDCRDRWPRLVREPLFLTTLCFCGYLALRTLIGLEALPALKEPVLENAAAWLLLWLLPLPLAWWLNGDARRVLWLLGLAAAGLALRMVTHVDWHGASGRLFGAESRDFGLTPGGFGLISAATLLGLIVFARRLWGPRSNGKWFWIRAALWAGAAAMVLESLIDAQERGPWLACLLVFPAVLFHRLRAAAAPPVPRRQIALGAAAVLLVFLPLLWTNLPMIQERLAQERDAVRAILSFDSARVPPTSFGIRFHFLVYGLEKWRARPLAGWGPGTSRHLIEQHPLPEARGYPQVHNIYVHVLMELGLIGALLSLAALALIVRALRAAARAGRLPYDLYLFLLGALALALIAESFHVRMNHVDGRFYMLMLGASCYTFRLAGLKARAAPP